MSKKFFAFLIIIGIASLFVAVGYIASDLFVDLIKYVAPLYMGADAAQNVGKAYSEKKKRPKYDDDDMPPTSREAMRYDPDRKDAGYNYNDRPSRPVRDTDHGYRNNAPKFEEDAPRQASHNRPSRPVREFKEAPARVAPVSSTRRTEAPARTAQDMRSFLANAKSSGHSKG